MGTRRLVHEEVLPASPGQVFASLHSPSAIRQWWSAARAATGANQDGFPVGPEADAFYAGCETGWADTFKGIRQFLADCV